MPWPVAALANLLGMSATRIKELSAAAATAIEGGDYATALTKVRAAWVLIETTPGMSREGLSVEFRNSLEAMERRAAAWLAEQNSGGTAKTQKIRRTQISRRPIGYLQTGEI